MNPPEKYSAVPSSQQPADFEESRRGLLPVFQRIGKELARLNALPIQEEPPKSGRFISTGNVSLRHPEGGFFITGSGVNKTSPRAEDLLHVERVDHELREIVCTGTAIPSRETLIHAAIYEHFPATNAVLHTHDHLALDYDWQSVPSTREPIFFANPAEAEAVAKLLRHSPIVNLRNHGQFIRGDSVEEALGLTRAHHQEARRKRTSTWAIRGTMSLAGAACLAAAISTVWKDANTFGDCESTSGWGGHTVLTCPSERDCGPLKAWEGESAGWDEGKFECRLWTGGF